jgi:hypothetical protein
MSTFDLQCRNIHVLDPQRFNPLQENEICLPVSIWNIVRPFQLRITRLVGKMLINSALKLLAEGYM